MDQNNLLNYWTLEKETLISKLETSEEGLTTKESTERLKKYGLNQLAKEKRKNLFLEFLSKFLNPLVLVLFIASFISAVLKESTNFLIINLIILVSTVVDFYQEKRAENAIEKLKKKVGLKCEVLRDGAYKLIPNSEVVPGDIILIKGGDIIPADGLILEAQSLFVDQSALTGESYPQEKNNKKVVNEKAEINERENSLFMGTHVVSGKGKFLVVETGKRTEFGKLAEDLEKKRPQNEFEKGINNFGLFILRITLILVIFVFGVNVLFKHDLIESLLFSLAIAIGLAPELLPVLLTINLSRGAEKMAKKGVITKYLPAIENFGSMEILFTDKTGTLTEGKISLLGTENFGGKEDLGILEKGYLISYFQNDSKNPIERAILDSPGKFEIKKYHYVSEIPFDFERRMASIALSHQGRTDLFLQGAPEEIITRSSYYQDSGIKEIDKKAREKILSRFEELSKEGLRVVAIASRELEKKGKYFVEDEKDLCFEGFIKFEDKPKEGMAKVIEELGHLGISIKILTGDNELVSAKVCQDLGIEVGGILLGKEIQKLSEEELVAKVNKVTIFARLNPQEKERIIKAFKKQGLVTGFLGDGINDAPSLRIADVGISVDNAVDIAKETADLILLKKDLEVLRDGVIEGRKTFGNLIKYIMMGTSSDFGNMFSLAGASLFLKFLPMLPVQVILNDFLYDVTQISVPSDNVDEEFIIKPRKWNLNFIRRFMYTFGPISSLFDFLTFFVLLRLFPNNPALFQTGWFMESIATQSLIVFSIRTRKVPFFESVPGTLLILVTFSVVGFAWVIPLIPSLAGIFLFQSLPFRFYLVLISILLCYFCLVEIAKSVFYHAVDE